MRRISTQLPVYCILAALVGPGCIFPPRRDLPTLTALESLSVDCAAFYATLDKDPVPDAEAEKISQSLAGLIQAQELRGKKNSAQIAQVKLVKAMFERQVGERRRDGPWKPAYRDERAKNFMEVLNAAIAIERSRPE